MKVWLMKSEPSTYSIDDLQKQQTTTWEGVRNYQARNYMRDEMKVGDLALFYHSNANPSGVVGICRICKTHLADHTAWDPTSEYFDPKSSPENPRWIMVEVEFIEKFDQIISLEKLKCYPELKDLRLLQKGSRLSILPLLQKDFDFIRKLSH